jgi:hypothetical protein
VIEPIVVTGPPGAGKSSVAALIVEAFPTAALVPGDAFFAFWTRGFIDPWRPESHRQNETIIRAAAAGVGAFSQGDCQVVYEGVLGPWFLPTFAAGSRLPSMHYVVLLPPVEACLARVAGRVAHPFGDPTATRQMHAEFARAALEERHLITDPDLDARAVAAEVLSRVEAGSVRLP